MNMKMKHVYALRMKDYKRRLPTQPVLVGWVVDDSLAFGKRTYNGWSTLLEHD